MGEFVTMKRGGEYHPLTRTQFSESASVKDNKFAFLHISKEKVADKSKRDDLFRIIAILQSLWFGTQCIARWTQRLPLAELEVLTLAYLIPNALLSCFWWNKPFSINRPSITTGKEGRARGRIQKVRKFVQYLISIY